MLENIANVVNSQLDNQGVPVPKTNDNGSGTPAPAAPPSNTDTVRTVHLPETPDYKSELEATLAENARLRAEKEEAIANKRLAEAAKEVRKTATPSESIGAQEIAISRAVIAAGGNANFSRATLEQKLALSGADPALAKTPNEAITPYFGKNSSAIEASGLKKRDAVLYDKYRLLARLKGIL